MLSKFVDSEGVEFSKGQKKNQLLDKKIYVTTIALRHSNRPKDMTYLLNGTKTQYLVRCCSQVGCIPLYFGNNNCAYLVSFYCETGSELSSLSFIIYLFYKEMYFLIFPPKRK